MGGAGPVAQQDTPVLGHASRSTLLSAVCRSAGHVLATNAALSIEERAATGAFLIFHTKVTTLQVCYTIQASTCPYEYLLINNCEKGKDDVLDV